MVVNKKKERNLTLFYCARQLGINLFIKNPFTQCKIFFLTLQEAKRLQLHEMLLSAAKPASASPPTPLCSWSLPPQLFSTSNGGAALLSSLLKWIQVKDMQGILTDRISELVFSSAQMGIEPNGWQKAAQRQKQQKLKFTLQQIP